MAVHAFEHERNCAIGVGEGEECLMPQPPENVGLGKLHPGFNFSLIPRTIRARRQNADAVMRRHHGVAAIDLGIVE